LQTPINIFVTGVCYAKCYAMASIHRQHGKPNWFCAFTDPSGSRCFRSTGTPKKAEAKVICETWGKAAKEVRNGSVDQQRMRMIVERTISDIMESQGQSLNANPVNAFLEEWLHDMERQISVSTFKSYSAICKRFTAHLGKKGSDSISTITINDIRAYRDSIADQFSSGTVNNHLTMLRLAFDSALQQDILDKNPAKLVKNLARKDKQERRPFTPDELKALLSVAPPEWTTAILIGLYTGLRLGDVIALKWEQVDLSKKVFTLVTQKTGRTVINPIATPLLRHLLKIKISKNDTGSICSGLRIKATKNLSNDFNALLAKTGLVEKKNYRTYKADRKRRHYAGLSFHSLRHTTTSMLKNTGASSAIAGDVVGHDSEAMQRNYTKIDIETKRKALDKLPDLLADTSCE
jgi:integrase